MIPPEHMTQIEELEDQADEHVSHALLSACLSLLAFTASEFTKSEPALNGIFTAIMVLFALRSIGQSNAMFEVEEQFDELITTPPGRQRQPLN